MEALGIDPAEVSGWWLTGQQWHPGLPRGRRLVWVVQWAVRAGRRAFGIAPARRRGYPLVERSNCP